MPSARGAGAAGELAAAQRGLHRLQDLVPPLPREHGAPLRAGGVLRHVRGVQAETKRKVLN